MASVTLSMEEFEELRNKERTALNESIELRRQLVEAKQHDITGEHRIKRLNELVRRFMDVARFGIGNLPPESIVGWPWRKLVEIAVHLKDDLPDFNVDDESFVADLISFAKECETFELDRLDPTRPLKTSDATKTRLVESLEG